MRALRFRGVLLPGDAERDIYVVDGRITFDGVPSAETVFDGGWIVPGLIDAHCHVGLSPRGIADPEDRDEFRVHARADRDGGVTTLRDCGIHADVRWMAEEADLPEIIRAGHHIARDKRYVPGLYIHTERADLPEQMAAQAAYGDGWVKLVGDWIDRGVGDLSPLWGLAELSEGMRRAHERGARVTAHTFSEDALPDLIDAGIDCIEHGTGITDDIIAKMRRAGTTLVPTVINIANFPDFAASAAKYPAYAAHMTDLYEKHPQRLRAAYEAGIAIYAGTDAGGGVEHGEIAAEVLALADVVGMTPYDALGAASWAARDWLGRPGVEEGAQADFVCFERNPLEDLNVLRSPRHVVLRGAVY